jgi:hypothetical protein
MGGCTDCIECEINNAAFFGNTDDNGPKPVGSPEFLDENRDEGVCLRVGWGSANRTALGIRGQCSVAAEPSTGGKIKPLCFGE